MRAGVHAGSSTTSTSTVSMPGTAASAPRTSASIMSAAGQPGDVMLIVTRA